MGCHLQKSPVDSDQQVVAPCGEVSGIRQRSMEAMRQNGMALEIVNRSIRSDKMVVLEAVRQNGLALEHAAKALRGDREVVLKAVFQNGLALQWASKDLRGDKQVVLQAVCSNGLGLKYASEELRADRMIVEHAVQQNVRALQYADRGLQGEINLSMASKLRPQQLGKALPAAAPAAPKSVAVRRRERVTEEVVLWSTLVS